MADLVPTPSEGSWAGLGWTDGPLAAQHDVALLDLDGVVYVGPHAVPHAAEALDQALSAFGMRSAFVTNNAARPPAVVAGHLRELGIRADDSDVVTSAQAGARVVAERLPRGSRVLAVGGVGVSWALEERGMVPVDSADDDPVAVMQGYGPDVSWRHLAEASLVIASGRLWVATNLDRTIPTPRGRVLGNGSLVAALRHATGVDPVVAGKPEPPLMLESVERTNARQPLVVGDRLDTDIEGATRSGIPSLVVLTGVTSWQDLLAAPPHLRPTYIGHDLRQLMEPAPRVRVATQGTDLVATCDRISVRVAVDRSGPVAEDPGGTPAGVAAARDVDWLPPDLRRADADPAVLGLDAVRALVSVAWAAQDRGWAIRGQAQIDRT